MLCTGSTGKVCAGLTPHRLSLQRCHGDLHDPSAELRLAGNRGRVLMDSERGSPKAATDLGRFTIPVFAGLAAVISPNTLGYHACIPQSCPRIPARSRDKEYLESR
jgi:hypothetical protein